MDHCSFTDPRKTEGWVGLVGWPIADTLPMKWSHVNHIIIEDYKTERNFDGMFSEERFDNFAENQIGRPKISTKHLTISLRKKHVFRKRLPHTWVRMHSTAPTKYLHQCVTTAFRWQEDADCPPNIQLFRRQDFCGCCSKRLEQFAVGLNEKPICHILPVQAVAENILFGQPDHGALSMVSTAPCGNIFTYLLTYWLTTRGFVLKKKRDKWSQTDIAQRSLDFVDVGQFLVHSVLPSRSHFYEVAEDDRTCRQTFCLQRLKPILRYFTSDLGHVAWTSLKLDTETWKLADARQNRVRSFAWGKSDNENGK